MVARQKYADPEASLMVLAAREKPVAEETAAWTERIRSPNAPEPMIGTVSPGLPATDPG